jgi:diguanylate cyclase (GGDEF)-like protein
MAASDTNPQPVRSSPDAVDCMTRVALADRLDEEVGRAERYGTALSCLLVVIDNLDEIVSDHGAELGEQTLTYVARALRKGLRRFDRVGRTGEQDLLVLLPGADSPRGEIVARRALDRLRAIKVEALGVREPLHISVGLSSWREDASAETMVAGARAALRAVNGDNGAPLHPQVTADRDDAPRDRGAGAA